MKILTGKDYVAGTHLSQEGYKKLSNGSIVDEIKAMSLINQEFGFEFSRIRIVYKVKTYRAGEGYRVHADAAYDRHPRFEAWDFNYVRFDCCGWKWEMIDGQLYPYEE